MNDALNARLDVVRAGDGEAVGGLRDHRVVDNQRIPAWEKGILVAVHAYPERRDQNVHAGLPGASMRRVAPAGSSWTVIVRASTAPSFRITWTCSPPSSTNVIPTV